VKTALKNPLIFDEVTDKNKLAPFYGSRCRFGLPATRTHFWRDEFRGLTRKSVAFLILEFHTVV